MSKLISNFIRVGVEGDTIDGRIITRQQIEEAAEAYNPKRYGARIWPEHFRGLIPDGPFDPLGDVMEAKAEEVTDVPELKGKLAMYVKVSPSSELVRLNRAGKKVYTSMELMSNYAKSGKHYLTGLAVTDEPASQGTEMMAFSVGGHDVFAGASHEVTFDFVDDEESTDESGEGKPNLYTKVKELLKGKSKTDAAQFSDINQSVELVAESQQSVIEANAELQSSLEQTTEQYTALQTSHDELKKDFTELQEKLKDTIPSTYTPRTPASGSNDDAATDC